MALRASSRDMSKEKFVSLAKRKDGEDIDAKRLSSLELVARPRFSKYGAILLIIASKAG
jgi:hypothetical protein